MDLALMSQNEVKEYWLSKMYDIDNKTIFAPESSPIDPDETASIRRVFHHLDTGALRQAARLAGVDIPDILYSSWAVLLLRYLRAEEVGFGAFLPNKEQLTIVHMSISPSDSLDDVVLRLKTSFEREQSMALTMEQLQELNEQDGFEQPYNTVVAIGQSGSRKFIDDVMKRHDLFIRFSITDTIEAEAVYRKDSFEAGTAGRLLDHLENVVKSWLYQSQAAVSVVDYLNKDEKIQLANGFNGSKKPFSMNSTIHELFAEQAKRTPGQPAVVCGTEILTYKQLDEQSNRLAKIISQKGIGRGDIIGIMAGPSKQMIVAVLGILKAGAAYLPIDPHYPDERTRFMLEDSHTPLLLTTPGIDLKLSYDIEVLQVDDSLLSNESPEEVSVQVQPEDLAYVIYTSGSTGTPKGVMIEHRSLINLAQWHQRYFQVTEQDKATKYAGFGFDASVWEVFPYLISGASLHVIPDELRLDAEELNAYFGQHGITISFLPTQLCEQFMEMDNKSLRILLTGGDKLKTFKPQRYELHNCYGPTENTVVTTSYRVTQLTDNIPIGKPIDNTEVLILDAAGNLQPVGIAGELCVSGVGLARGYLNRPELTAEKFVPHPFETGRRMYRTGDLARWLPDGTIAFMGRIDHQVKIRGFRIEIGEIEHELLKHSAVKDCVVMAREGHKGDLYLCAYAVSSQPLAAKELASFLSVKLPEYMIPAKFVMMEQFPVNANGKVDRKALPEPERTEAVSSTEHEANETEKQLIELWKSVLGLKHVGLEENFFEIGGHSLQASVLRGKIERQFGVRLPVVELFEHVTVKDQAKRIAGNENIASPHAAIEPAPLSDHYPLYPAQRRMYFIEQMEGVGTAYNTPVLLQITGKLDAARLERTFQRLIERHEILRTSFQWAEEELVQAIHHDVSFRLSVVTANEEEVPELMRSFVKPFRLSEAPLMRAEVITCKEERHYIMLDFHHIVVDGVSMHVFFEEWSQLYGEGELAKQPIQFKDFAVWYAQHGDEAGLQASQQYWKAQLAGELPVLQLPYDMDRPDTQSFKGDTIGVRLNSELTSRLRKLAASTDTTLYMILLAAYQALLARYSGQEDVIVGAPFACRTQNELQRLIGMFVNTLPLRSYPEKHKPFAVLLQETKKCVLGALENQEYELERVMQDLNVPRVSGRNPMFDTMFVMQTNGLTVPMMEGAEITAVPYIEPIAKYDLMVDVTEEDKDVLVLFQYCTDLFKAETTARMSRHYVRILEAVAANEQLKLSEIALLDQDEFNQQVFGLNDTAAPYRSEAAVQELFEEQALRTPHHPALVFGQQQLTYKELNEQANRLAGTLIAKGVQADDVVGLMADRSLEMIIGLLGILKAGGAYVPIDPEYPQERVQYMMASSGARLLLTQKHMADNTMFEGEMLFLDQEEAYSSTTDNPPKRSGAGNLLYVIYTSGTTGKPKGVMLEHRNMVNLIHYEHTQTNVDYSGKVLQFTTLSFDVCSQEIWSTLLAGGTLYLVTNDTRRDAGKLLQVIEDEAIEILFMPVSFLKFILNEKEYADRFPTSVRHIITAGEQLIVPEKFREHLRRYQVYLHNHYGPSETHVATAHTLDPNGPIPEIPPIGRPICNTSIYILNDCFQLQPPHVPGELYIAGDCVGRGYYGQEQLTAERYFTDPFTRQGRMYKTGDLARWNTDGTLEFLGRLDHQVKIRGFRIELGEIENTLLNHPAVKETIVLAKEDGKGGRYLCAYAAVDEVLSVTELRSHLAATLPDYMLPSYFVQLPALPLTPNGKIDRRALPEPELDQLVSGGSAYEAPRTEVEKQIADVWQDLLGVSRIGIRDNFFELGGHSLKAAVMVARLQKYFEMSINDVFEHQTIAALAAKVKPASNHLMDKLEQLKHNYSSGSPVRFDDDERKYAERNDGYRQLDLSRKAAYGHVLLTGATGYLGIHLLRDILELTPWTISVIIRGDSGEHASARLRIKLQFYFGSGMNEKLWQRVRVYQGDLTQERFGMPEKMYAELSRSVDCIVHAAATVKHYGTYDYFEKHNVKATEHLLNFASDERRKDMHHISTLGVASGSIQDRQGVYFTEYDLDLGQQYENYYAKTKFEAEKQVVDARSTGIRSSIYRVGNIVFQSETGKFQENIEENAFYTMIKSFIQLGMVPNLAPDTDFSYVDSVSKAIVLLMQPEALQNEIFHLMNPYRESLHTVLADGRLKQGVKSGSFEHFIDYMITKYADDQKREEIEKIMLHYGWLEHNQETVYEIAVQKTVLVLQLLGFDWEPLDQRKIDRMMAYCYEVGFL